MTTAPLTSITNYAEQTFTVGNRVRHSDGWTGTITGIREQRDCDLLLVEPDDCSVLRGYDAEVTLSEHAASRAGRGTYCRPRDTGRSMGNYTPL